MTKAEFYAELESIRVVARKRHEKARKAAAKRGRHDFPMLPYECSWAFEEELRKRLNVPLSVLLPLPRFPWEGGIRIGSIVGGVYTPCP